MSGFGMGGYVGTSEDTRRIARQEKEREEAKKQHEEAKKKASSGAGLRQFGTGSLEMLENAFKNETVGLVTRAEFVNKRDTIAKRLQDERTQRHAVAEEAAYQEKERQRAKRAKTEQKHKLSFEDDFGEEDEEEEGEAKEGEKAAPAAAEASAAAAGDAGTAAVAAEPARRRFATLGKDPGVSASFLPDVDRDRAEDELRKALAAEWALAQAALRAEPLDITYSYYNGTGHRRTIAVRKGDSVGQFLKGVQEQLSPAFREMRTQSVGNLMYVKEDIILPHSVTFYELIVNKARGKSGPLFQFDVSEHAVMAFDPRLQSQDTHAGKVVDRHWYSKNKHIFPASRWVVYDPEKHGNVGGGGGGGRDDQPPPPPGR